LHEFTLDVFHRSNLPLDDQNSIGVLLAIGIPAEEATLLRQTLAVVAGRSATDLACDVQSL